MGSDNTTNVTKFQGEVLENLPNAFFRIRLADGREVLGYLAGKMRLHHIRILPGDKVEVEMTPYDKDKARITYRVR